MFRSAAERYSELPTQVVRASSSAIRVKPRAAISGSVSSLAIVEIVSIASSRSRRAARTTAAGSQTFIAADWRIFDFATPKVSLAATGVLFPSITESGRYRTRLDVSLRREIVSDFYLDLSLYQTYDSDPPDATATKSDYGITTGLGYSFY